MKASKYRFTRLANADIDEIWESIARDNPEAADRIIHEIYEQIGLLAEFPSSGHVRRDLAEERRLLFASVRKYMIAYRGDCEPIVIVRILHGARNLTEILAEAHEDFRS